MPSNLKILLLTAVALTIVAVCVLGYHSNKHPRYSTKHHLTEAQSQDEQRRAQKIVDKMMIKERQQLKANQGH